MEINKETLRHFRTQFETCMQYLEEEFGVKIEAGSIGFSENDFRLTVTAKNKVTKDGSDVNQAEWNEHCKFLGLTEQHFGKTFKFKTKDYTIIGIRPNSRKYPVQAKDENGKVFGFMTSTISKI